MVSATENEPSFSYVHVALDAPDHPPTGLKAPFTICPWPTGFKHEKVTSNEEQLKKRMGSIPDSSHFEPRSQPILPNIPKLVIFTSVHTLVFAARPISYDRFLSTETKTSIRRDHSLATMIDA